MKELKTKVVILEASEKDGEELKKSIEKDERIEVLNVFVDAEKMFEFLKNNKVDILISELILQNVDGFSCLEKFEKLKIETKIVVLSSLSGEGFIQKAFAMGVDYYMIKPYNSNDLIDRIINISEDGFKIKEVDISKTKNMELQKYKQLDGKITNIFITVGIPAHIKGYQFLREAIKMAIENPEVINSITKKLYPSIAERFETSASKVERAIRHAIEVAWNRGKIENINTLFGVKVYSNNEKPTNGEFIALVADKMLIEGA